MNEFPIPVRMVGRGSQPAEEEALQFLAMPREMNTFTMPAVPEHADAEPLAEARDELAALRAAMEHWDPAAGKEGPRRDLSPMRPETVEIINQMLGEGEVAIRIGGERAVRIQESVFTGLWRVCTYDENGALAGDRVEAAAMPRIVVDAARKAAAARMTKVEVPAGAMNSPALIAEIAAQMRDPRPDGAAHVINLTLFPMTPEDHQVLDRALPVGPVAIMSRGFGNCRITSTGVRNVWRVQYFNSMNTLILNTIEIVEIPQVALAAPEDLDDSRVRLSELIDWMSESCAT
jgi:hydrogenase-1 operon protein HyaF